MTNNGNEKLCVVKAEKVTGHKDITMIRRTKLQKTKNFDD
jgi:hypothetical protein